MRRQRGRPRKYPRREGAVSVSSKRDRSPSQYEEEVPRKRLRAPDGTFMRKEIKDEIVTEDERYTIHILSELSELSEKRNAVFSAFHNLRSIRHRKGKVETTEIVRLMKAPWNL